MSFYAQYPQSSSGANPSIGTNGATAPTSSTEVGGVGPDGNLHPLSTDNSGNLNVNVGTLPLPTGAATATNQTTEISNLQSIVTNTTGVSTAANQTTANTSLASIVTSNSTIATNTTGVSTAANQASVIGTKAAGTAATNSLLAGAVYNSSAPSLTTGQQAALQMDSAGNLKVNSNTTDRTATGTIAGLSQAVVIDTSGGITTVRALVAPGGGSMTIAFQGTIDGTTWTSINAYNTDINTVTSISSQLGGDFLITASSCSQIRLFSTAYSSGSCAVKLYATYAFGAPIQVFSNAAAQFPVQAVQSGNWDLRNISGTVSLPTGAATAAKQPAIGTAGTPSVDVLTVQGSASGTALPVSLASAPLPTGGATSALQTTGNTSLSTLTARMAGSLTPVAYDEVDLTYVPSGNGTGQIATAVYKLASATQATLTMTYDSSNRLSTVVKS